MTSLAASRPDRLARGVALIVGAVFLMSLQDAVMKLVSADLALWQIFVLRSALAIPVFCALGPVRGAHAHGWIALRSLLLTAMYVAIYAAVPLLELSVVAAGFYTGPLFVTLFSALLIREPVGPRSWFAVGVGFLGVLAILRPGADAFQPLALLPVLAGACYALAAVLTRGRLRDASPAALAVGLNLALLGVGAFASLAVLIAPPERETAALSPFLLGGWTPMDATDWGVIVFLAVLMIGIGLGLAGAYQAAAPSVIASFDYSYLLFASFWGFALFAETPDAATLLGMALIAGAGLVATLKPGGRSGR